MRALAKHAPGTEGVGLVDRPEPAAGPDDVVLDVAACGICGTDVHLWHALTPAFGATFPLWLGHEYAGTVVAVGERVDAVRPGDRVTAEPSAGCGHCPDCRSGSSNVCLARRYDGGGFAPRLVVPAARVHVLPAELPWEVAALSEPLACAIHAVADVGTPAVDDPCVVVGPGPIGLLVALVVRALGATPIIVGRGRRTERLRLAQTLGMRTVVADEPSALREGLIEHGVPEGAGLTFGCAGGDGAVAMGLAATRRRGRYVEVALAGRPVCFDLDDVVRREVDVRGAMGHTPSAWKRALSLVRDGQIAVAELAGIVTAHYCLSTWREAFDAAERRTEGKILLWPNRPPPRMHP